MKVLFLQPSLGAWSTFGKHRAPNIGQAQLAGLLRSRHPEYELKVLDCRALELDESQMLKEIENFSPDIVHIGDILHTTGGAAVVYRYNQAAKLVKEKFPQVKIIASGLVYASAPKEILERNPWIDYCIVGEHDYTFCELVEAINEGKDISGVAGVAFRREEEFVITNYRGLITDLDELPLPAYDLFPMDRYVGHTYWKGYVETWNSRGCPAGCSFCYEWSQFDPRGRADLKFFRARSAKLVADELELLYKKFGAKVVCMMDDCFNVSRRRMEEFLEEMMRRDLAGKINWMFLGRAPYYLRDIDLFKDFRKAGCFMALVGIEVATDEELKEIGKGITVEQVKETVAKLRENKVAIVLTWMIGFENDDEYRIKKRMEAIDEIDPDICALQYLTPMPGSPIWPQYVERGWIKFDDLKNWDFHHPVVPTKHLSIEEVGRLGAWALREFYSKPGRIERVLYSKVYHPLVSLCFRDFMQNLSRFEKASKHQELYV
jgi:magnesium-protoporphyrin IX monomethyl ester (oxidative) cyclase